MTNKEKVTRVMELFKQYKREHPENVFNGTVWDGKLWIEWFRAHPEHK